MVFHPSYYRRACSSPPRYQHSLLHSHMGHAYQCGLLHLLYGSHQGNHGTKNLVRPTRLISEETLLPQRLLLRCGDLRAYLSTQTVHRFFPRLPRSKAYVIHNVRVYWYLLSDREVSGRAGRKELLVCCHRLCHRHLRRCRILQVLLFEYSGGVVSYKEVAR